MPTPSLLIVPSRFKSGKLYSQLPTSGAGDFTVTRATAATRVNASGFIESVASGIPRLDYFASGGTVGCPALLVEPAATNQIRNNSMSGAVTGTPGTLPTGGGWTTTLRGLTQTVVGTGTENGINYIDIRFSGTATSTDSVEIRYESTTQIVASSGQTWAHSVYLKKIVEPNPPNNYQLSIYERDSGGGLVVFGASTIVPTTTIQRFTQTRTLSGATTARVQPALLFNVTNGQTYDFTIRIGYPQMELGSVATSVIPTTTAAVTRNAEVVTVSGAVSGSIGQTQGTLYAEVDVRLLNSARTFIGATLNSNTTDFVILVINSSNQFFTRMRNKTGSNVDVVASGVTTTAGIHKLACSYSSGDITFALDGVIIGTNTNANTDFNAALNYLLLGSGAATTSGSGQSGFANDRIRAAALYTTRLTNAELAALTTP